jgi:UMF1 family MFS transporter
MLLTCAYTGAVISALFIFISPNVYYLAPFLVIIGVTSMGCSFSLLNAFLPLLVSNHQENGTVMADGSPSDYELEALNPESNESTRRIDPEQLNRDLKRSAKLSSKGIGYGYASAVSFQIFSIVLLTLFNKFHIAADKPTLPMRVILLLVGIWWAALTVPTIYWLRPRPGPPLPAQAKSFGKRSHSTFLFYALFSFRSFWVTVTQAFRLRQAVLFLIAWFLLSDAIATISGTAVLFARTELHMGTIPVVLLSLTSIGCGMIGAFAWPYVAKYFSLMPKTVLIMCIAAMEIIPLYGLLGYVPFIKKLGVGGLQRPWEIYPLGIVHGLVMGGINSYARSVFAPLIPERREAAFFALYAVTDKGSSAVGPALVGVIVDRAGTIRPAFIFLAVLVLLPGPLLWMLNVEKGREDAAAMAGKSQYFEVGDGDENEE